MKCELPLLSIYIYSMHTHRSTYRIFHILHKQYPIHLITMRIVVWSQYCGIAECYWKWENHFSSLDNKLKALKYLFSSYCTIQLGSRNKCYISFTTTTKAFQFYTLDATMQFCTIECAFILCIRMLVKWGRWKRLRALTMQNSLSNVINYLGI